MLSQKKGVSLVTVLLFMLVATIAATATFKWLTSENMSSASRMMREEARQGAVAGIENARSWMTTHANDVGAVVAQYFAGGKKPMMLNSELIADLGSGKQNFNVWVTGVTEKNGMYKLKMLSEGIARNGTKHVEAAILNVGGLYRVDIPVKQPKPAVHASPFEFNYFGGSMENGGDMNPTSILVNGNWKGNPNIVQKNFIVTGNAELSGDKIDVGGNVCIGGNLNVDNGLDANNLYVVGKTTKFKKKTKGISGNAYFVGEVEQENGGVYIGGNMTAMGTVKTKLSAGDYGWTVNGNLCVGENAKIRMGGTSVPFQVIGSVWAPGHNNFIPNSYDNENNYDKILLGSSTEAQLYIADGHPYSDYTALRSAKTYEEYADWRKVCHDSYSDPMGRFGYYWCYESGSGEEKSWTTWNGQTYTPYISVSGKENMYYFYYVPSGQSDVVFDQLSLNYAGNLKKGTANPTFPTMVGTYLVNGQKYYSGNTHHLYNYTGGSPTGSPYCKESNDTYRPECHVFPWFKSLGTLHNTLPSDQAIACAEDVRDQCESVWTKKPGCEGAQYKVDDMLVTAYDKFLPYASKGCAASITSWSSNLSQSLNSCYSEMMSTIDNQKNLYNGYLVVKVSSEHLQQPSTPLAGHFIIILDNKPNESVGLPPTNDTSKVFLYLSQGTGANSSLQPADQNGKYNYFIFTKANVASANAIGLMFNNTVFDGSVYATADNCSKVPKINTKKMNFNQDLMNSLMNSGVVCDNDGSPCGGNMSSTAGESSSSTATTPTSGTSSAGEGGVDPYYVSIAPQLSVILESQYKASEKLPKANEYSELSPSIIVLPRIIYLPKDPEGTLSDYFNVLNLNGAEEAKDPSKVSSCEGDIPRSGPLGAAGGLEEGPYKCIYSSETYGDIPFYVVVKGESSAIPAVYLENEVEELVDGGVVYVYAKYPKSNHSASIKFDVSLTKWPSGWHVEKAPGLTEHTGLDANKYYYTVEAPLSNTEESRKLLFTITADDDAEDANVYAVLMSPTENCTIGIPYSERVFKLGRAKIQRKTIGEYCSLYPDICEAEGYNAYRDIPECNLGSTEWVKAEGSLCTADNVNESWACMTASNISLKKSGTIPVYCTLLLPTENNEITGPVNGEVYSLYASIKRKPFTLDLTLEDAKNNETKILVYDDLKEEKPAFKCSYADKKCTYTTYYGANITLAYETHGADDNHFSYWKCTGDNCSTTSEYREPEFAVLNISGNNSVIAKFNQRDHCFYEDFADTKAFCGEGQTDCIDTCAVALAKGQACGLKESKQEGANWLMMYNNAKGKGDKSVAPTIMNHEYIYTQNDKNANNQSGTQSQILSTVDAGPYGTMTSMFQTTILKKPDGNDYLNSGLLFRCSQDECLILNVFGVSNGSSGPLTARVCKIKGHGLNNYNGGLCRTAEIVTGSGTTISVNSNSMVKISFEVSRDDKLFVTGEVNSTRGAATIDLNGFDTNDDEHRYVGYDLSDASFKIYDIGWMSSSFNDDCWDVPSVTCSFKANYLGGRVPLKEDVTPWVGVSSWFDDNNCVMQFYYNGDDNEYSSSCTGPGCFSGIGSLLNNSEGIYHFTKEGQHGVVQEFGPGPIPGFPKVPGSRKFVWRDAKVKMNCPGDVSSLALTDLAYGCGTFWVGDLIYCSENFTVPNDGFPAGIANIEWKKEISSSGENFRGADLIIEADWNSADPNELTVYLESKGALGDDTYRSLPATISAMGPQSLNVDVMSNTEGFDPEKVSAVIIVAPYDFRVHSIMSSCPYAIDLTCNSATLNANTGRWEINYSVTNGETAVCEVTSDNTDLESIASGAVNCADNTKLEMQYSGVDLAEVLKKINENGADPIKFTVTATSEKKKKFTCSIGSEEIKQLDVTCDISQESITQGAGVPAFKFTVGDASTNCPASGCPYTLTLPNSSTSGSAPPATLQQKSADMNSTYSPAEPGTYTYRVNVYGASCSKDFEIVAADKTPPSNLTCNLDANTGNFTASLTNVENAEYSYSIGVTDRMGNEIGSSKGTSTDTWLSYSKLPTVAGEYQYVVRVAYGGYVGICDETLTVREQLSLSCPTSELKAPDASFMPTVTGCGSGETCSWSISGAGVGISGGFSGAVNVTGASDGESYTVTLTRGSENKTCEVRFKAAGSTSDYTTDCWFANSGEQQPGSNNAFKFKNLKKNGQNWSGLNYRIVDGSGNIVKTGMTGNNNEENISVLNPVKTETWTLQWDADGSWGGACTAEVNVKNLGITCSKINEGGTDKFRIQVSNTCANNACPYDLRKNDFEHSVSNGYGSNLGNSEYKIPFDGVGTYTLYVAGEPVSGCTMVVQPSATCPSSKLSFIAGQTATFKASGLSNCGSGCDYLLAPESGTAFASDNSGSYSSASTGITFTAPSATNDNVAYTFTVYDKNDHSKYGSCTGTMAFVDASAGCHCEVYCQSGCDNIGTNGSQGLKNCMFLTTASRFKIEADYYVNGKLASNRQICWNGTDECTNNLKNTYGAPVDGGYYIYVPDFNEYTWKDFSFTASTNPCGGSSGSTPSDTLPSDGIMRYGSEYTFLKGKTYSVTCEKQYGGERSLVCKSADGSSGHSFTYGGTGYTLNSGYGGASATCSSSAKTLVAPSDVDMKCRNDY